MAYLVIAVGLLTSLAGGYLINYGYAIVQVERGWSSVIAGSVFVSGGLVTMGLGLLLRAIADVRRGLVEGRVAARSVQGADPGMAYPELGGAPIGAIAVPAGAAEPSFASRDVDLYAFSIADEVLPREVPPREVLPREVLPREVLPREVLPREVLPREPALGTRDPLDAYHDAARGDAAPVEHDDQRHDDQHHDDQPATEVSPIPSRGLEAAVDAGGLHPTQPVSTTREVAAEAPAMDDWLDRAFSEIDGERPHALAEDAVTRGAYGTEDLGLRQSRYETQSTQVEPTYVELAPVDLVHPDPIRADPGAASATAEARPPNPPSPVPPPHDSPVIGRYESDDTSYVMYADGSIEAQSPAGVYRFSSMAELKAFIEG